MAEGGRRRNRPLSRGEWAAVALSLTLAAGVAAYWWRQHRERGPVGEAIAPTSERGEVPSSPPFGGAAPAPFVKAPPATVQAQLGPASAHPLYRRALLGDDVLSRWVVVLDDLAEGASPRRALELLAPDQPFTVSGSGGSEAIAAAAYARYDAFGDAVASVDVTILARAYHALHPAIETAYRALGYPPGALDRATARALRRIVDAPVMDGEVIVVNRGGLFVFANPALEQLPPVEKHLLRIGPRNTRLLQDKARALQQALGLDGAATRITD
ncbi:DUF3014 domain-containing protein [Anaeromyxobacter oryzisoli]|uniref:DUF3014 domain-containing protein n=1 Tax=Anaeromyxobacter oryzisoli TaxID=2925408 RepID=UPI001F58D5A3|nr:DUF3014 domain-containing protein [Anaeromyxobacter sp. SG63]